MDEYPTYQQDIIVGASLQVSPPLGQYDPTRLLNVGTNRWSIRPELGVSKAWGPVILELIPAVTFFTNNNDFLRWTDLRAGPHLFGAGTPHLRVLPRSLGRAGRHLLRRRAHDHRRREGRAVGKRASGPDRGAVREPHQSIKFYGSNGVYSRSGGDFWATGIALAIPLGRRAVVGLRERLAR